MPINYIAYSCKVSRVTVWNVLQKVAYRVKKTTAKVSKRLEVKE